MTNPSRWTSTQTGGVMVSSASTPPRSLARSRNLELRLRLLLGVAIGSVTLASPAQASGQLVLYPDPLTLVVLIIGFAILIAPLNAAIFRPLFRMLDARDAKIAGATDQAGRLVAEATALTERYRDSIREAREVAEAARKQQLETGRSEHSTITGEARAESEDEIGRARQEIERSLAEARTSLERASEDLAMVAAERILGRPLQ